jgi:hypothetical protein
VEEGCVAVVMRRNMLGRSVRTERYRYTEWGNAQTAELYDHEDDPHEFTNLVFGDRAHDPKAVKVRVELQRYLAPGAWKTALPPG